MELKRLLCKAITEGLADHQNKPVHLELSGGCDSASLFACLLELKIPFECSTYYFRENADVKAARQIAEKYNKKHYLHRITEQDITSGEIELAMKGYPNKKALIDCLIGHIPIANALHDSVVINGSYADILWGAYGFMSRVKAKSVDDFILKRNAMMQKEDADGTKSLSRLFSENGNRVIYPYNHKDVIDAFMGLPVSVVNDKKTYFYSEFGKYFLGISVRRRSQQIASGIRDFRGKN